MEGALEQAVGGLGPERELRQVGLAEKDAPGGLEPADRGGIGIRHQAGEDQRTPGRSHSRGVEAVLGGERHPVQGAAELAADRRLFRLPRLLEGAVGQGHERVDPGIYRFDPVEEGGRNLHGGELLAANPRGQPGGVGKTDLFAHGFRLPFIDRPARFPRLGRS